MGLRVDLGGGACLALALFCLTLPLDWLLAALLAAAVHETGHLLAVLLLGGRIHNLTIGPAGAVMDATPMTPGRDLIAILAGPGFSFALLLLARWIPKTALCGLAQGFFNLLPLYPLDGRRTLACLFPGKRGLEIVEGTVLVLLLAGGLWGTFVEKLGIFPLLLSLFLLSRAGAAKKSCKEGNQRVQ